MNESGRSSSNDSAWFPSVHFPTAHFRCPVWSLLNSSIIKDFDEVDGAAKSRKKSKKSLKVPKESTKGRKGSNSESQRRLRKSVTSRKRPDKTMQTMCTKILINDLKKFEMEAWHAKRRLVVQSVHPISTPRMHSNRLLPPPQLPPRSNENDVSWPQMTLNDLELWN